MIYLDSEKERESMWGRKNKEKKRNYFFFYFLSCTWLDKKENLYYIILTFSHFLCCNFYEKMVVKRFFTMIKIHFSSVKPRSGRLLMLTHKYKEQAVWTMPAPKQTIMIPLLIPLNVKQPPHDRLDCSAKGGKLIRWREDKEVQATIPPLKSWNQPGMEGFMNTLSVARGGEKISERGEGLLSHWGNEEKVLPCVNPFVCPATPAAMKPPPPLLPWSLLPPCCWATRKEIHATFCRSCHEVSKSVAAAN